ncbi:MAG: InlB B-repeat-containing protein [Oscillospiraceae bacterium]|nr:InlB B-repeat-containing protein [Oscillospiraceae bacterium]
MKAKRLCSLLLSAVLLCSAAPVMPCAPAAPLTASAADGRLYNQWDEQWKEVTFTKYSRSGNSLYTSACGIFSFCNAMYALNSRKVDVVELATWAVDIGALRPGAGGTYRDILYKHIEEKWGAEYGFTLGTQQLGTVRDEEFIEHLKNGGVAVLYVPGHFIAVTGYDEVYQTYHVIESAVSAKRGLEPDGWVTADKLTDGGTNGTWYVLISNIKAPEYAKVSLPRTLWGVDEYMRYTLDSNTRNAYTVRFYDGDSDTPLAELPVEQKSHSSTQYLDCALSYAGDYTVDIAGENEFGKVQSERIGLRVYDRKITGAGFSLLTAEHETGKPLRFRTSGSPAAGYTLKVTDASGSTVYEKEIADMLDSGMLESSEAEWTPEYPGEYSCTATLHNVFGDVTPAAVSVCIDGDVPFTLDAAGGTLAETAEYKAAYEGKYGRLPVPVRDNHRFDGWFTAAEGGTQVTADTVMTQTHPHSVYAHWTKVLDTGDIDGDHNVDITDVQLVLIEYVNVMSGKAAAFDAAQNKAADISKDGAVGIEDAQYILKYYVENTVAGKSLTWEELLEAEAVTTTTVTTTVTTTTTTAKPVSTTAKPVSTTAKSAATTAKSAATTAKPVSTTAKSAATTAKSAATTAKSAATTAKPAATTAKSAATTAKSAATTAKSAATTAKSAATTAATAGTAAAVTTAS